MIELANLLDLDREIGRRSFVRRMFAMGAGIAASGALVRGLEAMTAEHTSGRVYLMPYDRAGVVASPEAFVAWAERILPGIHERLNGQLDRFYVDEALHQRAALGYVELKARRLPPGSLLYHFEPARP